jgi:hypothetical protein
MYVFSVYLRDTVFDERLGRWLEYGPIHYFQAMAPDSSTAELRLSAQAKLSGMLHAIPKSVIDCLSRVQPLPIPQP